MTNKNTFFITTPIYYTNGIPHIGHAYSSLIADSIARYNRISGKKVKFSTGVDENSQKVVPKAEEKWLSIKEYLDLMAEEHKKVWDWLKIEYTDFVRTTDETHHKLVREVLQKSFDNGDIYEGEYEGMYCVGCEAFKKDEDLVYMNKTTKETFPISDKVKPTENIIKVCPDHLKEPDTIKEKNYFFKLSKYQKFLEDFYEKNPEFIQPADRFNEVKAFVKRGLEDFSISRETNKFWVKLPFDESQVTYVWYDALFNYVTVTTPKWQEKECSKAPKLENWQSYWPADLHVVWKDIIRFHWIYWPAMLKSAGLELPKNILTTGFFTVDGQKISKSLWNAIDPVEFSEKYSKDLLTLYLLSSFNIGQDWDFDQSQAVLTYNAKLANNLGNLVNRVVVLSLKLKEESWKLYWNLSTENLWIFKWLNFETSSLWKKIEDWIEKITGFDWSISWSIFLLNENFNNEIKKFNLKNSLDLNFKFLDALNDFTTQKEPWKTIKEDEETTREVLYTIAEWLRQVWLNLYVFFPEKMAEMFKKLGLQDYKKRLENWELEKLRVEKPIFEIKEKWEPLFKRVEIQEKS